MLRRIYIDNFRSFTNFELSLGQRCLLMGPNGGGKSSLLRVLQRVRQFVVEGQPASDCFPEREHTRWVSNPRQTIELEFLLDGRTYLYRLVTEPVGAERKTRVFEEAVRCDGREIFSFREGEIQLYNDKFEPKVKFHTDWHRSGLGIVTPRPENQILTRLLRELPAVYCFQINPFSMKGESLDEDQFPNAELSNYASWYRHLVQSRPDRDEGFRNALRSAMEGFQFLKLNPHGEDARVLEVEFGSQDGLRAAYRMQELSEGQRCLLALYAVVHFLLPEAGLVLIDEPDNFVSLREIQPWLAAAEEILNNSGAQLVLISHHPEILNQWAPDYGVILSRTPNGPTRVKRFSPSESAALSPAELIARGWEHE